MRGIKFSLLIIISVLIFLPKVSSAKERSLINEIKRKEQSKTVKIYYEQGMEFYSTGSYEQAIASFLYIVNKSEYSYIPEYNDATFYLAESYYQYGMLSQAYKLYRRILNLFGENYTFYSDCLQRLMEISILLHKLNQAQVYYKILTKTLPENIVEEQALYLLGKAYFDYGKFNEAYKFFNKIGSNNRYFDKANYYLATIDLLKNRNVKAFRKINGLEKNLKQKLKNIPVEEIAVRKKMKEFYELVIMAKARIFFEAGDYVNSKKYYDMINSDSIFYAQSLYEKAWILVMNKNYGETFRLLYKLAEVAPDSPIIPKAQLLYGYCYIEKNRYKEAEKEFKTYLLKYGKLETEINAFAKKHQDPIDFYKNIMGEMNTALGQTPIPEDIVLRLKKNQNVKRSEKLVEIVDNFKNDLEVLSKRLEEVKMIAKKAGKGTIIPGTIFSRNKIKQAFYIMKLIEMKLLQYKKAEIIQSISLEGAKVLGDLYRVRNQTLAMDDEILQLRENINKKRNELIAIEKFISSVIPAEIFVKYRDADLEEIPDKFKSYFQGKRRIIKELSEIDGFTGYVSKLQIEVSKERKVSFLIEKQISKFYAKKVNVKRRQYLKKINYLLSKVEYLKNQIKTMQIDMEKKREDAVSSVSKEINNKQSEINGFIGKLDDIKKVSERVRGKVVFAELKRINKQIDFYSMQAHMGFIDIAWKIKEENEAKVNELNAAKMSEVRAGEDYFNKLVSKVRKEPVVEKISNNVNNSIDNVDIDNLDKLKEDLDLSSSMYGFSIKELGEENRRLEKKVKQFADSVKEMRENPFDPFKPVKVRKDKKSKIPFKVEVVNNLGWAYSIKNMKVFIDGFLLFAIDDVSNEKKSSKFIGFDGNILPGSHNIEVKSSVKGKKILFFGSSKKKIKIDEKYSFESSKDEKGKLIISFKEKGSEIIINFKILTTEFKQEVTADK